MMRLMLIAVALLVAVAAPMARADEIDDAVAMFTADDGLTAADLGSGTPLFGDGVGLDSIDALEIGAALRKRFHVKFKANAEENRAHFRTVASLADFIASNQGSASEG